MRICERTDEHVAGQRLMVGFDGTAWSPDLGYLIDKLKIGGVVLFSRNLSDPEQIKDLCTSIQDHAKICGVPPLFIAIDQEGGQVARLKAPFTRFPGNPYIKGIEDAAYFAEVTAKELGWVGINMNLAPVLDVAPRDVSSVMIERSFGYDPKRVSTLGAAVIEGLQQAGIMAVAKHFPGIGRTTSDSHVEMPALNVDMADLESIDLIPFKSAIRCKVSGIMLSHILYAGIDPLWPASLSPVIAETLLRQGLGFNGLVLTDDLDMGAIEKNYALWTVVKQILSAEIDLALVCHRTKKIEQTVEHILKTIADSAEARRRAGSSWERIMRMKKMFIVPFGDRDKSRRL